MTPLTRSYPLQMLRVTISAQYVKGCSINKTRLLTQKKLVLFDMLASPFVLITWPEGLVPRYWDEYKFWQDHDPRNVDE